MINDYYCVWTKADERGVVDLSDTEPESGDSGKSKRVVSMCDWSQGDDFLTSFFDVYFFGIDCGYARRWITDIYCNLNCVNILLLLVIELPYYSIE